MTVLLWFALGVLLINIDVVSGFLGAGKTTLIRQLLHIYRHEQVVLIENEFGEIGIDGELVERDGFEVFEISSGCICCIMQQDFVHMLQRIIKEFQPQRIIIEPTGISILSEIIDILRQPGFIAVSRINSLITVVDSVNYLQQREVFGEFFEDQIGNASVLILSKSQHVDGKTLEDIVASLQQFNPGAEIICAPWDSLGEEDFRGFLDVTADPEVKELLPASYKPCRQSEFSALALKTSRQYNRGELETILGQLGLSQYGQVLRAKGFLKGPDGYLDFSYTNGRFIISESRFKTSGKMCLIGKDLQEQAIKDLFKVKNGRLFSWLKF